MIFWYNKRNGLKTAVPFFYAGVTIWENLL